MAEYLNWSLCFMSAWIVGKVEAPAKANIILANALMEPSMVGLGYSTTSASRTSNKAWMMIKAQAAIVVIRAPTATGLMIISINNGYTDNGSMHYELEQSFCNFVTQEHFFSRFWISRVQLLWDWREIQWKITPMWQIYRNFALNKWTKAAHLKKNWLHWKYLKGQSTRNLLVFRAKSKVSWRQQRSPSTGKVLNLPQQKPLMTQITGQ